MCGICGVIGVESGEVSEPAVRRMMAAMRHRGPDDVGTLIAQRAAVGMRRLSILDLPGGAQPVWNENGTLAVVFNGEIYNFRELRVELEAAGHLFRTRCDTEVIVHAYDEWGERCAKKLRGMFAFAAIEMPHGPGGEAARVFLARDPLGIKPLYYAVVDGTLLFASELRALLATGRIPAHINGAQLPAYLLFGSACEPDTLIEGVHSLPPACSMMISADRPVTNLTPVVYWDIERQPGPKMQRRETREKFVPVCKRVRSLLEDAVSSHLVADVPVGVFLSSGIDSTALAALASRVRPGVHTFTVAFADGQYSEARIARRTAQRLGTEHFELTISDGEMVARLDEAVAAFDQPSMDGINSYFVSWAARQAGLKVALSGLGSDELFGGYATFQNTASIERVAALARLLPASIRGTVISAFGAFNGSGRTLGKFAKAAAAWIDPNALPHPYFFTRLLFPPQAIFPREAAQLWQSQPCSLRLSAAVRQARLLDRFTAVSWLELRSYMLNTLLRDTDAMSMCNSLEVRVPFLDTPLVEYILSLPQSAKLVGSRPKALLIEAMGNLLPGEIIDQPKRTFTFPWERWLRGELGKRVAAGLQEWSPALEPHVSHTFAAAVWQSFLHGRTTWSRPWSLYVLNEWVKRNVSTAAPASQANANPVAAPVA